MTFANVMKDVQRAFEAAAVLVLIVGILGGFAMAARSLVRGQSERVGAAQRRDASLRAAVAAG